MKLDANISLIDITAIARGLRRYRYLAAVVAIMAVAGYTALQISRVIAVPPDEAYFTQQQDEVKTPSLKLKAQTVSDLRALRDPGSSGASVPVGKRSPFSTQDLP